MKLEEVKLTNFRGYGRTESIRVGSMLALVGKNDVGKSTILEALDIFFNDGDGSVKMTSDDINRQVLIQNHDDTQIDVEITCVFSGIPNVVVLDEKSRGTSLAKERLLRQDGRLEIVKVYPNGGKPRIFIVANRPKDKTIGHLLEFKLNELKDIASKKGVKCTNRGDKAALRQIIINKLGKGLPIEEQRVLIPEAVYKNISKHLPHFELFQADRKNTDTDATVRDPMKAVVKKVFEDPTICKTLSTVGEKIEGALKDKLKEILEKVKVIDKNLLPSLHPFVPKTTDLKWWDVIKGVSLEDENNVPLNKRGSGVQRMVLLGFFMAEADKLANKGNNERHAKHERSVIYAIEEPETAQHYDNQVKMIEALKKLSNQSAVQVLITTHSANMLRLIDWRQVCIIEKNENHPTVRTYAEQSLSTVFDAPTIAETAYLLLDEFPEAYHDELYGYIESKHRTRKGTCDVFKSQLPSRKLWERDNAHDKKDHYTLSYYVRNSIHHPENKLNDRYTREELEKSIAEMRDFILREKNLEKPQTEEV